MTVYCDNWACPALVSCARHFGRSQTYAAMRMNEQLVRFIPDAGKDCCAEYATDKPRVWNLSPELLGLLMAAVAVVTSMPKARGSHG